MGFKKAILALLLLIILTMGAASAADTNTTSDNLAANENTSVKLSENDDFEDKLGIESENPLLGSGNSSGEFAELENAMSLTKDSLKEDKSYDDILSVENDLNVLSTNYGTYSGLSVEIGSGGNIELNCDYYTYDSGNTITITTPNSVINGKGAIIDMAGSPNMRAFEVNASGVTIKNLTIKNSNYTGNGGAIYFNSSGTVENCNFTNNTASNWGGAVYFSSTGNVTKCNFFDNKAYDGGAVYFLADGTVSNCNFTNNNAVDCGGAVFFWDISNLTNCNFTDNSANNGGAVYFYQGTGSVTNCNFIGNKATYNGGAVYFNSFGTVTNCNFTGNTADNGGAITMTSGTVTNCTFTNNTASNWGGAVFSNGYLNITNCDFANNKAKYGGVIYSRFSDNVKFRNCNFTNNLATINGGAINFEYSGTLINCNFINNTAPNGAGGAVIFYWNSADKGNVINCNFTNNTALYGSAILFDRIGDVTNCNFTNNQATGDGSLGGAVYFYSTGTVTNCNFTNNKATGNGGALYFSKNGNVTNCNFTDNSASRDGGAIYFAAKTTGRTTNCNFTNNQAISNYSNGGAIYFSSLGIVENCNFTNNTAYYGGAIYFDILCNVTNCTFSGNSDPEIYLNNHTSFTDLADLINSASPGDVLELDKDYQNDGSLYSDGIEIAKAITINGNGHTIDAKGLSRIFNINAANVVLNNITLINGHHDTQGGAIYWNGANGTLYNSSFMNCTSNKGGAIQWTGTKGTVIGCNFENNTADTGGAIYWYYADDGIIANSSFYNSNACAIDLTGSKNCRVTNCNFVRNIAYQRGGSIHWYSSNNGSVSYCNFTESHDIYGGAVFWHYSNDGSISNCNFEKNTATNGGAIRTYGCHILVSNSKFVENRATLTGGAIEADCSVYNCTFINNTADSGGAIEEGGSKCTISECTFIGNNANSGGAAIRSSDCSISNCTFEENTANYGGAINAGNRNIMNNCTFTDCSSNKKGGAVYLMGSDNIVTSCTFINCSSTEEGGAIVLFSENNKVDNSIFINSKGSSAKAIYVNGNNSTISNSNFEDEKVKSIYELINQGKIINCTLNGNKSIIAKINIINSINEYLNGNFTFQLIDFYTDEPIAGVVLQLMTTGNIRAGFSATTDANGIATFKTKNLYEIDNTNNTLEMRIFEVGNHTVELKTSGNVESASINANLTIIKANINLAAAIDGINVTVTATNKKNDETVPYIVLHISYDNQDSYLTTDVNGTGKFIANLPCGTHTITLSTNDTKNTNYTETNITIDIPYKTFQDLSLLIANAPEGSVLELSDDYIYGNGTTEGIEITKAITIDGNGHTLDAKGTSRIFKVNAENVILKNIIFKNGHGNNGGAIQWMSTNGVADNCTFINCSAENGGSVYWNAENGMINTSTFDKSTATSNGGAIYWNANGGEIANSTFTNSKAQNGGAIYVPEDKNVEIKSSIFDSNNAEEESGAVYGGTVDEDCTFKNNTYTPISTTTFISINETKVYTGNDISITTIVLSQKGGFVNTGTVEIYINSQLIATIPANAAYTYTTGDVGYYQLLAKFNDDSSYKDSSNIAEFTVIPVDIPEEIETSNDGIYTLEFPDNAEGTLTVFIDGTKYKVYDITGGILTIDLSYKKGKYNVSFEYSGDNNYPAFKKDVNATIQTNPSITASPSKALYSAGTTYKITVYKNKGKIAKGATVVIKLNNKKFKTTKTNPKGVVSFKITQKPGTYKLKITSLGITTTKTLTVKHILTLKTVKVKKSAKKLILQATLAKVNKKYLKNKQIIFKFNGKTYKAKTNKKGVAKVTIKKPALKKLKVGKKITYQATYSKDTVKKTAKVKK